MIQEISSPQAPKAIGPYSQAIKAGELLFISGQIPLNAKGEIAGANAGEQARQCLSNLRKILAAAGASTRDVVKTTIYLTDLSAFADVNAVYSEFCEKPFPARATVQVSALPKGALVEIEAIAVVKDG